MQDAKRIIIQVEKELFFIQIQVKNVEAIKNKAQC